MLDDVIFLLGFQ